MPVPQPTSRITLPRRDSLFCRITWWYLVVRGWSVNISRWSFYRKSGRGVTACRRSCAELRLSEAGATSGNTPPQHRAHSEGMNWKVPGPFQISGAPRHERVREKHVWATRETMRTST